MPHVAPMLKILGYDPYANPPDYGSPDLFVKRKMEQIERNREEWNRKEIKGKEIYSDAYIISLKEQPKLDTGKWENWETRYISSSLLNLTHQMDIYEDTIAIYNWHEEEIFGVLIKNKKVADFQKQIFDILFEIAKPEVT